MGAKHWLIFVAIVAVVIGGMIYTSSQGRLDVSDIKPEQINKIVGPEERNGNIGDNFLGNKDAKVVLVEYGDYQCAACKSVVPETKMIVEKYKDSIAFVYRNFPLTSIHPNALAASASAQAAGLQGKFWEMNSLLFREQENWQGAQINNRNEIFISYAEQLGLNIDKFKEDTASQKIAKKIDFDVAIGKKQGRF